MGKIKKIQNLEKIFYIFIIGSVLGYICEMIVGFVQNGHFVSRQGLIYGPFTPVYGIGAIIYYIFFNIVKNRNKLHVFLFSMILGGVAEYLFSYVQEKMFGTISWNYENIPFNFHGRTSLLHCTYWGIAGILYIIYIEPLIKKIDVMLNKTYIKVITILLVIFMVFNITISVMAGIRQKDRMLNIPPQNNIERFLDRKYPDYYMNKVFANKKIVNHHRNKEWR